MNLYRVILCSGSEELLHAPDLATAQQLAESLGEPVDRIIAETDLDDDEFEDECGDGFEENPGEGEDDEGLDDPFENPDDESEEDID